MHDWYDWTKDIALPLLTGGGSVLVGGVAIAVARQSHKLAEKVRADEAERQQVADRERYRDQMLRVVEPAVEAMLAHREEVQTSQQIGYTKEGHLRSAVITRLFVTRTVATEEDAALIETLRVTFDEAIATREAGVLVFVLGHMVLGLAILASDSRNIAHEITRARTWVAEGKKRARAQAAAASEQESP